MFVNWQPWWDVLFVLTVGGFGAWAAIKFGREVVSVYAEISLHEASRSGFAVVECLPPEKCEHIETICSECLTTWEIDWRVQIKSD